MDKLTEPTLWLKEFSKSWVNIVSNEIVYQEQAAERNLGGVIEFNGRTTYIEDYLCGHIWFEIIFKIGVKGAFDLYIATIASDFPYPSKKFRVNPTSRDLNIGKVIGHDETMFVNIVNSAENPQRMITPLPIRSVIRLHRFDVSPDIARKLRASTQFRTFLADWEGGSVITHGSNIEGDIVKGTAQPVGDFAHQEAPRRGQLLQINVEDILPILRVFIDKSSVRYICNEGIDFIVEDIKVFLRPVDTDEGVSQRLHMSLLLVV